MELNLRLTPEEFSDEKVLRNRIREATGLPEKTSFDYRIERKSMDARQAQVVFLVRISVYTKGNKAPDAIPFQSQNVSLQNEVHIIGAGPAGLFAALQCIELGWKPVIFERGKNVRDRRRDLALLNKEGILNEESNYCFGEGGAGTYSDGKLYTRSSKRGDVKKVLQWFYHFGAEETILYEAHPHIGTNKLPKIIERIREAILECGGEIHFGKKLTGMERDSNRIQSIVINQTEKIKVQHLILATGHSASDIYELLHHEQIRIEQKPFALGVRIEHPQYIIDRAQYHCLTRSEFLPPASYSLVEQVNGRGVFSFCMCPGGIIAPASTQQKQLVVNGWSPSKRNNPFANSGMVVSVSEQDYRNKTPLGGLYFQQQVERKAYEAGGGRFVAPAQRLTDFVQNQLSSTLPECSYVPGIVSTRLNEVLPGFVSQALREGLKIFGKKMKGYYTSEALLVATESRTSSPVRIPRMKETFQHIEMTNLYPCAEGAGYAGGIVSAAMDGIAIVTSLAQR